MSASSTLPRTNTWSMSPSVITSVAFAPRLRMEDTGLPSLDVAREHRGADGCADGGVRQVLARAVGRGLGLGDLRARLGHARLADEQLGLRGAPAVFRHLHRAVRIVECGLGDEVLIEQRSERARRPAGRSPRRVLLPRPCSSSAELRPPRARPVRRGDSPRRRGPGQAAGPCPARPAHLPRRRRYPR